MPSFSLGRGTLLGVGYIRVEADTAPAESKLAGLGKLGAIGATGFLALTAAGVASVKMASDFNNQMLKVQTQAGASAADVKTLSAQILNMKNSQFGPDQLAEAMYHLKSVGMDNVDAMKSLKVASDLAAVGGSDLEATTNALAGAWRSGIKGAQTFSMAAGTVNAIIGAGNMKMSQFVAAIGTGILPAAKTFGIGLDQIGASLALMTDEGVPAQEAATRLKTSIALLAAPSGAASKQLAKIGLTGLELANTMRGPSGLVGAIQLLHDHLDSAGLSASQQGILLSHAFGGGRSSSAIMTMVNNLSVLQGKLKQIDNTQGTLSASIAAQQATLSAKIAILKSSLESTGIKIGEVLIGPVTAFVGFLSGTAIPALGRFADALAKPLSRVGQAINGFVSSGFLQQLVGSFGSSSPARKAIAAPRPGRPLPPLTNQYVPPALNLAAGNLNVAAPFTQGYGSPNGVLSGNPLNVRAPRTGLFPSPVAIPLTAAPAAPKGLSDLAKIGQTLHDVLENLATALSDVMKASSNLAQALGPFLAFLAKTGLAALSAFASILAHDIAPALLTVSQFLKENSGLVRDLLIVYLTPLAAKMLYMSTIKSIKWFYDLGKDIIMFPINQIGAIKDSISGFTAAGGALDGIKLKLMYVGDALKSGAGHALDFAKNAGGVIQAFAKGTWDATTGTIQNLGQGMKLAAQNALEMATNAGKALGTMIASGWRSAVQIIKDLTTATKLEAIAIWDVTTKKIAEWAIDVKDLVVKGAMAIKDLAVAAAEGVWAAVQAILDVELIANPIGLIVVGIAALVAAIVWIATKTTWFQTIWHFVWGTIKQSALDAWHFLDNDIIHPIADAFSWLWTNGIQPALRYIIGGFLGMVDTVLKGALDLVSWVPGIGSTLKGVVKDFEKLKDGINQQLGGIAPKTIPVTVSFTGIPAPGTTQGHVFTSTTGWTYASGGQIPMSAGTPGKDSVPIMAMPGEFVVNTKATAQNLGLLTKINAGKLKGYAGGGIVDWPGAKFDTNVDTDLRVQSRNQILTGEHNMALRYLAGYKKYLASMASTGAGGSIPSGAHLSVINAALAAAGVPPPGSLAAWQLGLNTLIGRESGWNPNAINLTDSNAAAGDPSRGLAQTIMSTFQAYVPNSLRSAGIYDAVANVAAAVRYIVSVYGDITNVQQANPNLPPKGYDVGGLARGRGLMHKYTALPERVLSPRQTAAFETMVGALDRGSRGRGPASHGSGGDTYVFNFTGPVGSKRELQNWLIEALTDAKRNNRLAGLVG